MDASREDMPAIQPGSVCCPNPVSSHARSSDYLGTLRYYTEELFCRMGMGRDVANLSMPRIRHRRDRHLQHTPCVGAMR